MRLCPAVLGCALDVMMLKFCVKTSERKTSQMEPEGHQPNRDKMVDPGHASRWRRAGMRIINILACAADATPSFGRPWPDEAPAQQDLRTRLGQEPDVPPQHWEQ